MKNNLLKTGDRVKLKGDPNSPEMTYQGRSKSYNSYLAAWFSSDGHYHSIIVHPEALEKIEELDVTTQSSDPIL